MGGGVGSQSERLEALILESPEDLLKRRLAKGEIDRDEYEETLRELRK